MTQDEKLESISQNVNALAENFKLIREDNASLRGEMRESIRDLADAINALVRVEERQSFLMKDNERIVAEVSGLKESLAETDKRIDELEKQMPMLEQTKKMVWAGAAMAFTALVGVAAKYLGITLPF